MSGKRASGSIAGKVCYLVPGLLTFLGCRLSLLLVRLSVCCLFIVVLFFLIVHIPSIQSCECFLSAFLFNFLVGFGISVHIFSRIPTQRNNIWLCLRTSKEKYIFLRPLWGPSGSNKFGENNETSGNSYSRSFMASSCANTNLFCMHCSSL